MHCHTSPSKAYSSGLVWPPRHCSVAVNVREFCAWKCGASAHNYRLSGAKSAEEICFCTFVDMLPYVLVSYISTQLTMVFALFN